jgi:excisionase family DNA binding protein
MGEREKLLTPDDVAVLLGKSRLTIVRWCARGVLKGIKVGKTWRIKPEDLDAFLDREAPRPQGEAIEALNAAMRPGPDG